MSFEVKSNVKHLVYVLCGVLAIGVFWYFSDIMGWSKIVSTISVCVFIGVFLLFIGRMIYLKYFKQKK